MKSFFTSLVVVGACLSSALAQSSSDPLQEYTISADNITAKYIGYGARLTSMIVKDRDGADTQVAVGYDDPSQYIKDTATNHTYFGEFAIVNREWSSQIARRSDPFGSITDIRIQDRL